LQQVFLQRYALEYNARLLCSWTHLHTVVVNHKAGMYRLDSETVNNNITGAIASSCDAFVFKLKYLQFPVTEGQY